MIIEQVKPLNARPDVSIKLFNKAIYSSNENKGNLKIRRINMVIRSEIDDYGQVAVEASAYV